MESGEAHVVVKTQNSGLGVLGSGTSLRHLTDLADRGRDLRAAEGWQVGINMPIRPIWPERLERAKGRGSWIEPVVPTDREDAEGPGRGSGRKP